MFDIERLQLEYYHLFHYLQNQTTENFKYILNLK